MKGNGNNLDSKAGAQFRRTRFTVVSGLLHLPARGRQGFNKNQTKPNHFLWEVLIWRNSALRGTDTQVASVYISYPCFSSLIFKFTFHSNFYSLFLHQIFISPLFKKNLKNISRCCWKTRKLRAYPESFLPRFPSMYRGGIVVFKYSEDRCWAGDTWVSWGAC